MINMINPNQPKSLVFIDTAVSDYQSLVAGVDNAYELIVLDPKQNGIYLVTDVLASRTDISTVHIVSHGSPGCLYLGNAQLSLDSLKGYAAQLQQWDVCDLVLYGCNVADQVQGRQFVDRLAQLTGAEVYASNSLVGSSERGGTWELRKVGDEEELHPIDVFTPATIASYAGVFATATINPSGGTNSTDGLKIDIYSDGNFYITESNVKQVYSAANTRTALAIGGTTYSSANPLSTNPPTATNFTPWLSQGQTAVTGTGNTFDPYKVVTSLVADVNSNGTYDPTIDFKLDWTVSYAAPNNYYAQTFTISAPAANTQTVKLTQAFDSYLTGLDQGPAYGLDANGSQISDTSGNPQFIGVRQNPQATDEIVMGYIEGNTPFSQWYSGFYGTPFTQIVNGGNLTNTYNTDSSTDNGVAVQYNLGALTGTKTVTNYFAFSTAAINNLIAAPTLVNNTLSITEGQSVVLSSTNLNSTDPNTLATALTYSITGVTNGRFELVSNAGVAITSFTQAQINNGQVRFVHDGSENAPGYNVSVSDGTTATPPAPVTISFTNVNDAPVLTTNTLSITEGQSVVLGSTNFNTTDPDTLATALTYSITGVTNGRFELVSNAGVAITSFTQAQINNGQVRFVHDGSENAPGYNVSVSDGIAPGTTPAPVNISFTNVNDAPVLTTNTLSITKGQSVVLGSTNLNTTDPDTQSNRLTYSITGVTNGRFELVSNPGTAITSFTQAQINNGLVRFVHDGSNFAPSYNVTVSDENTTSATSAVTIGTFTNINNPPVLTTNTLSITEGQSVVLGSTNLNTTDSDTPATALTYSITGVTNGRFELVSNAGVAITSFTQEQINNGQVRFVHDGSENAPGYNVSVSDGTTPTPPSAVTIGFTNVNNPPVLTTNTLSITEGQSVVLGSTNLNTTDSDTPATALTYSITGVTNGRFELVSNVGVAITSFTQAQINNGQVRFVHDGSENAPGYNVSVSDGTTPTPPSRVTISFTNVNDAPTLTGTKATLAAGKQDTVYTINQIDLLTGFTDAENDPLSVSNLTATNGTLVNNNNGTWSFTPAANYNGTINLIYNVTDGKGGIAPATQSFNLDAAPPSTISISNPNPQNEGNSGTVAHNFEVSLSNPSSQVIVVNYDTTDGSANFADADYNRSYGNLVFKPGETKKTITVTSNGDNRYEANETFNVNLSDPINATIAKATAIGTINNDDSFPGIAIADVSQNEGNSGTTNFNFAVTLSNPSYQTVSVNYATADGISVASKDYNSTSGVLTFNPGEITKNISVAVIGNTVAETNKNFLVNLSNPSNGTIVNNRGVGTIVNDDSSLVGTNTNKTGTQNGPTTFSATDFTAAGGTTPSKIKITTLPNNGTLQLGNSNVVQNQEIALTDISNLRFTPATGWNGTTNFTWKGFDGVAYSNTDATVNLTINRVNNPPFLNLPISTQTATTNSLFNFTFAADTFKDLDVGDILTYTATLPNGNPLPSWLFFNPIARTFVGTPTTSDAGNVTILLKATDSANASVNYPFNLNIANTLSPAPANSDIDCFCEQIIHPNVNNLPGVSSALNSTEQSQLDNDEDNSLFGTSSNDLLHGFGGNDLLLGREGDDNVLGGKGNDLTFGGEGRDWIGAGFGDDFANGNEGDDFVNGNEGNDTVRGGLGQDFVRGGQDNDILYGDRGNDTLGGDHGNDTLFGGSGDAPGNDERDLIFGGSGDDLLYGNTGNDSLFGEQGNDTIRAGKDHDIASGDAGDDVLFGDHGNDSLCGCDGNDTIFGGVGANGGDASPSDDDYICGGAGNDLLFGNQGADWINGEVGDDTIYGGQGNDTLIGRDGNDILSGDRGNDSLMGGNGSDKFVLAVGQGSDVIVDFQDGVDSLVLSGNLTFPQLSIVQSGNNTLISLTNNNELLATLNGISANLITAQDFLVALS